jgi:hypothetical protein
MALTGNPIAASTFTRAGDRIHEIAPAPKIPDRNAPTKISTPRKKDSDNPDNTQ